MKKLDETNTDKITPEQLDTIRRFDQEIQMLAAPTGLPN